MEKFTFSLFSHKTYKYFYFLLLYYLTTRTMNSMEIRLQESNKLIYDSNIVDGLFNFNPFRNKNNCSCDYTYTIGREQNSTIFTIFKNKNEKKDSYSKKQIFVRRGMKWRNNTFCRLIRILNNTKRYSIKSIHSNNTVFLLLKFIGVIRVKLN